jgi:hypothetical protein
MAPGIWKVLLDLANKINQSCEFPGHYPEVPRSKGRFQIRILARLTGNNDLLIGGDGLYFNANTTVTSYFNFIFLKSACG